MLEGQNWTNVPLNEHEQNLVAMAAASTKELVMQDVVTFVRSKATKQHGSLLVTSPEIEEIANELEQQAKVQVETDG